MKKALLGIAALTGTALTANAALLKVSDQTFANFGLKMQIYGQSVEDAANKGKDDAIDFTIQNARIYFSGQLNPIVQFGANLDFAVTGANTSHEGTTTTKVRDAFINFHFMDELNVMAGYYRLPFSRTTLVDRYNTIFMPQDGWLVDPNNVNSKVFKNQILPTLEINAGNYADVYLTTSNVLGGPSLGNAVAITGTTDESDFARDAGVTIWGDILNGMIKYYVGIYDGFGDHNAGEVVAGSGKDNLGYAIRVQFTPTMLGFQGEKGYLLKETYLGKKNVLSFGLAYASSKLDLGGGTSFTFKSWAVDANYEQKFGVVVPKVELGYVYTDGDNLPLRLKSDNTKTGQLDKVKTYYVTLGILYDQKLFLGKVGAYIKYQKTKVELNNVNGLPGTIKPSVWTVAIPYYLADQNAKIVLQWNHYDYDKNGLDPRNANDDTNNDWTLAFQVQF
ncbi:MAG: hypothetical protein DSZ31_04035 [Gammaproteobacteria bacterium]|nr:MAG: hypothetical protein DSZ31_04035 [Gammaproteobacteria bacterium]